MTAETAWPLWLESREWLEQETVSIGCLTQHAVKAGRSGALLLCSRGWEGLLPTPTTPAYWRMPEPTITDSNPFSS